MSNNPILRKTVDLVRAGADGAGDGLPRQGRHAGVAGRGGAGAGQAAARATVPPRPPRGRAGEGALSAGRALERGGAPAGRPGGLGPAVHRYTAAQLISQNINRKNIMVREKRTIENTRQNLIIFSFEIPLQTLTLLKACLSD